MRKSLFFMLLSLTTAAWASAPEGLESWTRRSLDRLPTYHEDREVSGKAEQLDAIARAVADVSRDQPLPPQQWATLVLLVGHHESGFSMRIIRNECKKHECDRGRARGFGQVWRNSLNGQDWLDAPGNVAVQAKLTSDALERAYWNCKRSGVDPIAGTLSAFAGKRCGASWPGLQARLATYARLTRAGGKS